MEMAGDIAEPVPFDNENTLCEFEPLPVGGNATLPGASETEPPPAGLGHVPPFGREPDASRADDIVRQSVKK